MAAATPRGGPHDDGSDVAFLSTVASQMALGLEDVRLLQRLEQKQASLMRADRLATLGRLASGVAHEMGSPIGAVLSALRVLDELGQEYAASTDEPTVTNENHHEIAREIVDTARKATDWAQRASTFLKQITKQSRAPSSAARQPFMLGTVITETTALLAHRLRAAGARLDVLGAPDELTVVGIRPRSARLANLIGNALDAYEESDRPDRRLAIEARSNGRAVVLSVQDWRAASPTPSSLTSSTSSTRRSRSAAAPASASGSRGT